VEVIDVKDGQVDCFCGCGAQDRGCEEKQDCSENNGDSFHEETPPLIDFLREQMISSLCKGRAAWLNLIDRPLRIK